MKTLEQVLQDALNGLRAYPTNVEELAVQLHNITEACENEAKEFDIQYIDGTHTTEEV